MTYLIVPASKLALLAGRVGIVQRRTADARLSLDGTRAVVKYSGAKPAALLTYEAANGPVTTYTQDEILVEMQKPAWFTPPIDSVVTTPELVSTGLLSQTLSPARFVGFVQRHRWKFAIGAGAAAAAAATYLLS